MSFFFIERQWFRVIYIGSDILLLVDAAINNWYCLINYVTHPTGYIILLGYLFLTHGWKFRLLNAIKRTKEEEIILNRKEFQGDNNFIFFSS